MTRKITSKATTSGAGQNVSAPKKPRKKKERSPFNLEAIDEMLGKHPTQEHVLGLFNQLKKALVERALSAELTHHLGYERGEGKPDGQQNHRNGSTPKTIKTDEGELSLEIPRDRASTFEPQFV